MTASLLKIYAHKYHHHELVTESIRILEGLPQFLFKRMLSVNRFSVVNVILCWTKDIISLKELSLPFEYMLWDDSLESVLHKYCELVTKSIRISKELSLLVKNMHWNLVDSTYLKSLCYEYCELVKKVIRSLEELYQLWRLEKIIGKLFSQLIVIHESTLIASRRNHEIHDVLKSRKLIVIHDCCSLLFANPISCWLLFANPSSGIYDLKEVMKANEEHWSNRFIELMVLGSQRIPIGDFRSQIVESSVLHNLATTVKQVNNQSFQLQIELTDPRSSPSDNVLDAFDENTHLKSSVKHRIIKCGLVETLLETAMKPFQDLKMSEESIDDQPIKFECCISPSSPLAMGGKIMTGRYSQFSKFFNYQTTIENKKSVHRSPTTLSDRGRVTTLYTQLLLFSLLFPLGLSSNALILSVPPFGNVVENNFLVLPCKVKAEQVSFLVNGSFADDFFAQGFSLSSIVSSDNNIRDRNLTVLGYTVSQNSRVQCIAYNTEIDPSVNKSEEIHINVQGPLSSVANLSYSFIDSSIVNVSWTPPFTLPGTDILGYNVSVTRNGTTTNDFTPMSYSLIDTTNLKGTTDVMVSGFNGLNGATEQLSIPIGFEQESTETTAGGITETTVANETTTISSSTVNDFFHVSSTNDIPVATDTTSDSKNANLVLITMIPMSAVILFLIIVIICFNCLICCRCYRIRTMKVKLTVAA